MGLQVAHLYTEILYVPSLGKMAERMDLECQFNPAQLNIKKAVSYSSDKAVTPARDYPRTQFAGGGAASYTLELHFDAYVPGNHANNAGNTSGFGNDNQKITASTTTNSKMTVTADRHDIRKDINRLMSMSLRLGGFSPNGIPFPYLAEPPSVYFVWGDLILFRAVLLSVDVTYTSFALDGTPIHAVAKATFVQQSHFMDFLPEQNPTSRTNPHNTVRVTQGDRIDNIASNYFNDARMWRSIAEENDIDDPFNLESGSLLSMPVPKYSKFSVE